MVVPSRDMHVLMGEFLRNRATKYSTTTTKNEFSMPLMCDSTDNLKLLRTIPVPNHSTSFS